MNTVLNNVTLKSHGLVVVHVGTRSVIVQRGGKDCAMDWQTLRAAARQDDESLRVPYAAVLHKAEQMLLAHMQRLADNRTRICGDHRVARSKDRAYLGPVSRDENRAAHGNICVHETCSCGAGRRRNVNGRHEEIGAWSAPDVDLTDVRNAIDEGARQ